MKILGLYAENVKRIKAIEISPDGNLIQITGENANGKSSIFDAIWWALDGLKNVQKRPIRDGEDQAIIQIKLGEKEDVELVVTRTFQKTPEGFDSKLKVESTSGASFPSPQIMLDKFLGALTFDPLAFSRMSTKEQFEQLKKLVPGFDFAKAEQDNKADFDLRTMANRALANAKGVEASVKDAPLEEPEKPNTKALTDRLANAAVKNAAIEKEKSDRNDRIKREVNEPLDKVKNAEEEAMAKLGIAQLAYAEAKKKSEQVLALANAAQNSINTLPLLEAYEDVTAIKAELDAAIPKLDLWNKWDKRKEARKVIAEHEAKVKDLTESMEKRTAAKVKAITEAKLPVPGITLGDGIVLMNDIPFDQASDAEKLVASTRMAMATNPKLKIILIKDGSLLDKKAMDVLSKMAEDNDYQIWVERVDGSGSVGFVIEDGRLKLNETKK